MHTDPLDSEVVGALSSELGEPAVFARLVRLYLDRLGDRLEAVVNAEDATALAAAAHSLKSASGTFGAQIVADIATELEAIGERGEDAPAPLLDGLLDAAEDARRALEQVVAEAEEGVEIDVSGTQNEDPPAA
jgi:HPt (histidine-containing phosphotransfer) domain-containing protein